MGHIPRNDVWPSEDLMALMERGLEGKPRAGPPALPRPFQIAVRNPNDLNSVFRPALRSTQTPVQVVLSARA
jgi:hypothetical protein